MYTVHGSGDCPVVNHVEPLISQSNLHRAGARKKTNLCSYVWARVQSLGALSRQRKKILEENSKGTQNRLLVCFVSRQCTQFVVARDSGWIIMRSPVAVLGRGTKEPTQRQSSCYSSASPVHEPNPGARQGKTPIMLPLSLIHTNSHCNLLIHIILILLLYICATNARTSL